MEDNISKIKERVDIVDLIGGYLKVQKSGTNFRARCPFHNEKSASFYISPERQIWHCFGCNAGGDIFGFVKQIEGVEFPEALRILAGRAGIELQHISPELKNETSKLYEICALAAKFYEKQLYESNAGKEALGYLRARGLTDETIKRFGLGYAPNLWQGLSDFLSKRYGVRDMGTAGLVIIKDQGGCYDRFRSRIMFPIADTNGQVVGFSGRIFNAVSAQASNGAQATAPGEDGAKYINSPQTPIYDKGRILFGFDKAKLPIRTSRRCLVVEGNVDVVLSHQAGVDYAVAPCGTALTEGQLRLIHRYTESLDLCFDADGAGSLATDKAVTLALAQGFNVGIVAMDDPSIKDPADYVQKHGAKWQDYAKVSKPFLEFYFKRTQHVFDIATPAGKKAFSQKLVPFVAALQDRVEQSAWVNRLALVLKIKEDVIRQEVITAKVAHVAIKEPALQPVVAQSLPVIRLRPLEEGLVSVIMRQPSLLKVITAADQDFFSEYGRKLLAHIRDLVSLDGSITGPAIIDRLIALHDQPLTMTLEFVYLKSQQLWEGFSPEALEREAQLFIFNLRKRAIASRLEDLESDIKLAEQVQDRQRLTLLIDEFSKVSQELRILG